MPQTLRRLAASALLTVLALAVALASAATIVPNSPYQAGPNSVAIVGGGTAAEVAAGIAADSGMKVDALWLLKGGVWVFFLPAVPGVDGGLSTVPDPAAAVAVLSAGGGGGLPPAPGGPAPSGDITTATMSATGATVKLGNVTITVPPGAMPLGAKVSIAPATLPPLPPGWAATGPAFKVTTTAGTTKPLQVKLGPPLTASGPGELRWVPMGNPTTHIMVLPMAMVSERGEIAPSSTPLNVTVVPVKSNAEPLTIAVGSATTAKAGQPVGYTADAKGGTPPYTFDVFADGNRVSGASVGAVTFQTEGLHKIQVTVTDQNGKQATGEAVVSVTAEPLAVTLTGPAALAHGGSGTYTANISGGVGPYTLAFEMAGHGNVTRQAFNPPQAGSYSAVFTFPTTGSYTVTAVLVDANGQGADAVVAVTVHEE